MQLPDILRNRYTIAYTAALLLHLLLLLLSTSLRGLLVLPFTESSPTPASEPISFEFVDSDDLPSEAKPPEDARLASTRNAVSRDLSAADLPASDRPYSEGLVTSAADMVSQPQVKPAPGSAGQRQEETEPAEDDGRDAPAKQDRTDFASVLKRQGEDAGSAEAHGAFGRPVVPPSLQLKNLTSKALERGGLQLSTYDWAFGPYLAYLKERIEGNLRPPALFRDYGAIDGQTVLKFRIYRDGTLEGPNVEKYTGSPLLRETSVRAVEMSAQFRPLPDDFPDDYLEITGLFDYVVIRNDQ